MLIEAIKSPIITADDDIITVITRLFKKHHRGRSAAAALAIKCPKGYPFQNGDIMVIASKVLAITQNRLKKIKNQKEFQKLVEEEADEIIGNGKVTLTIKENIFIPWAGIDRSNAPKNLVVLWPSKPYEAAEKILSFIKKKFQLKKAGVVIADSFCAPLRKGTSAVALGYAGFQGVRDLRGQKDLYQKELQYTQEAVADNLAAAANLIMGESAERRPFAIIRNAPVVFTQQKIDPNSLIMEKKECLYAPLYERFYE